MLAVLLAGFGAEARAADPTTPLGEALGRAHPLFIHLPLALLGVAFVAGLLRRASGSATPSPTARVCLRVGAVGAAAAAVSGWLRASGGAWSGASAELLGAHRTWGVAAAALAVAAFAADVVAARREARGMSAALARGTRFVLLGAATCAALTTGSAGGALSRGPDYWTSPFAAVASVAAPAVADASVAEDAPRFGYPEEIAALFGERCVSCHGPAKRKGGLRLDAAEHLFADGAPPASLRPGDPEGSDFLRRLGLEASEKGAMPPDGPRLATSERDAVARWIADFCRAAPAAPLASAAPPRAAASRDPEYGGPRGPLGPAEKLAVATLRAAGAAVEPVAAGADGYDVDFSRAPRPPDDAAHAALRALGPRVVAAHFAGVAADDRTIEALTACVELRRLSLQETAIGDAGVARLAALPRLLSLNLYGTRVTDAGVDALARGPMLRRVYLWNTAASPEAMARLRSVRADLRVEGGVEFAEPAAATK